MQAPEVRIGSYQSCRFVASGVTAEVYSSGGRALKVITETRNIEPHNPAREARILAELKRPCIPLLETFRDQEQRFVLVFPYMPLSLEMLLARGPITPKQARNHFMDLLTALQHIHSKGIIHRDVKPSALLLESPDGPAVLSDFGAAWHPQMSLDSEPEDQKVLDIGTGPYRAPEVLFGNRSYGPAVDMWGTGAMLAESCRNPPRPLFESRPVHEDGNQLGLILSIFRTMGSPTPESWPEAASFRTPPFEMYRAFEHRAWEDILPDVEPELRALIARLVVYNSTRASATEVSPWPHLTEDAERTIGPWPPQQFAGRPLTRTSQAAPSGTCGCPLTTIPSSRDTRQPPPVVVYDLDCNRRHREMPIQPPAQCFRRGLQVIASSLLLLV